MIHTYAARRRLELAPGVWREPDELLPEGHTWFRIDSYCHTGYVNEVDIPEDEFRAAIAQYCPELEDRLLELAGITAELEGPHRTPARAVKVTVTKEPAKKKASTEKA